MAAIEIGASGVIDNNAVRLSLATALERDLLMRIATQRALVTTVDGASALSVPEVPFVAAALEAVRTTSTDQGCAALVIPAWWSARARDGVVALLGESDPCIAVFDDAQAAIAEWAADGGAVPETLAVVSLRAAHSSVVIVENCQTNPVTLPSPALVHDEGGDDLDAAVLRHVLMSLESVGITDGCADARAMESALRQCRMVRESLSGAATESVRLDLPGVDTAVRLVRGEIEDISLPWVDAVVHLVMSALDLYGAPVDAVLLTGGVATMPLVSQRLSADLGIDVLLPAEPALISVRGAERLRSRKDIVEASAVDADIRRGLRGLFGRFAAWRHPADEGRTPTGTTTSGAPQHPAEGGDALAGDLEEMFAAALRNESPAEKEDAKRRRGAERAERMEAAR